jgi:drug/metabolite transporter (DMT)-like permease
MRQPKPAIFLILAAACWGLGTIASKAVLDLIPPLTLLVIQLTTSISFLWIIFFIKHQPFLIEKELVRLGLAGLLNPGLAYTFALIGLSMSNASMSSLIWAAEPALILGLAWLVLKERPTNQTLLFSMLAIAGAILVIGFFKDLGEINLLSGNLLIVLAVFCCAVYTVLSRQSVAKVNPILLTAVQQTVSLCWALLIWPFEYNDVTLEILTNLQPNIWFWAIISGLIYYALAFWFYIIGLQQVTAIEAGLYLNLIPIFGVSGAFLFLGDRLSPVQWLGAACILIAVFAISILQKNGKILQKSHFRKETLLDPE